MTVVGELARYKLDYCVRRRLGIKKEAMQEQRIVLSSMERGMKILNFGNRIFRTPENITSRR
jgi:hypothetical protein